MTAILLIILPLLIPIVILGHFFMHLFSHHEDKYERIYRSFSYVNPFFTSNGRQPTVGSSEQLDI